MTVMLLVAVVALCTDKIIKNDLNVFEGGEHLLQNGVLHLVFSKPIGRNHVCAEKKRLF